MLRVLFVCPHFAPTNAPDGHRVRLLLPYLKAAGIEGEVLTVEPGASHFPVDSWLNNSNPNSVPVHRANALSRSWAGIPGLGSLSSRSIMGLKAKGDQLLTDGSFDLIYFSTTQFGVHLLGPRWKQKFRVPFFMDFQDPWVNDYYRDHPDLVPPGGKLKFALADWFNRKAEPRVLSQCSGITSVSPAYPESLARRYADPSAISEDLFREAMVASFPAERNELQQIQQSGIQQSVFDPADGNRHWVYTGRCGPFMEKAVRSIFQAIRNRAEKNPHSIEGLRLHFIGTSYSGSASDSPVEAAAHEFGLEKLVQEIPERIPLSESLRCLLDADSLFIPGSDDPGYNASKIYPYLMTEKPLLAVFHQSSPITGLIQESGGGLVVPFSEGDAVETIADRIEAEALTSDLTLPLCPLDHKTFYRHTAEAQAIQLGDFFRSILHPQIQKPEIDEAA